MSDQTLVVTMDELRSLLRMQNTSHAVMAQRIEPLDAPDDFPTPPWATRALLEHVVGRATELSRMSCLEPACGAGHMARVLNEYFGSVQSSDAYRYGYGSVADYLATPHGGNTFDWVITNPPFRLGEEFIMKSLMVAKVGVAMLTRTVFIESIGRYERLFKDFPLTKFAQFCERVPMVRGRLDKKATTATGYAWLLWEKNAEVGPKLVWVPPCRKQLERVGDYDVPAAPKAFRSANVTNKKRLDTILTNPKLLF